SAETVPGRPSKGTDMCNAVTDVRFGSEADTPEADMCSALADVRIGPIVDIDELYSITWSARASTDGGIVRPNAFAVLRLITSSYLGGACTGMSAGFSPLRRRST